MTEEDSSGGKGKRGASGPLVTTSDEDENPESPRSSVISPSNSLVDHDYENVSSPGNSSTASGPTYIRPPGFTHHAQEIIVTRPRIKKKKTAAFLGSKDGCGIRRREPTPPKHKPRRDPLPMRMRALPQSFWQQPNVPHNVSPANAYPILPPLFTRDGDEVPEVRPVTPPDDRDRKRMSDRKITIANTDLLFKLFENVEKEKDKKEKVVANPPIHLKRGRPRKVVHCHNKLLSGEDPYLMDCVTEKLFPQLTLEHSRSTGCGTSSGNHTLHLVTLREGDKSVTLPTLSLDQNYSQMLNELVMHI